MIFYGAEQAQHGCEVAYKRTQLYHLKKIIKKKTNKLSKKKIEDYLRKTYKITIKKTVTKCAME